MIPGLRNSSTKFFIYPYGYSNSAIDLCEGLNGRLIRREGSRYAYRQHHKVINWGSAATPPVLRGVSILNRPEQVAIATSKLRTFSALQAAGIPTCTFTRDHETARNWGHDGKVLGRDLDRGSGGRGIVVYGKGDAVGRHSFYTKYHKKERELRVHVLGGTVIFEQEKLRKTGAENADKYIRSHDRGWCFAFHHLNERPIPDMVRTLAINAVGALFLDFGAVDIGWNSRSGPIVFEVNTAPGIEESSLAAYVRGFRES